MKERPILFSGQMVRALLDGRKTQTRRVCKVRTQRDTSLGAGAFHGGAHNPRYWAFRPWDAFELLQGNGDPLPDYALRCPYGTPSDRLWVREAHSIHHAHGQHRADDKRWGPWDGLPTRLSPDRTQIAYYREGFDRSDPGRWRPSIHMPRWASRLTLEVTNVRVERVQDISEADAIAEGVEQIGTTFQDETDGSAKLVPSLGGPYRDGFRILWSNINGADSWDANPWVWVVSFKAVGQ